MDITIKTNDDRQKVWQHIQDNHPDMIPALKLLRESFDTRMVSFCDDPTTLQEVKI